MGNYLIFMCGAQYVLGKIIGIEVPPPFVTDGLTALNQKWFKETRALPHISTENTSLCINALTMGHLCYNKYLFLDDIILSANRF